MAKVIKDSHSSENPKNKYQVLNWSDYNKALVKRGDITIYFSDEAIENWYSDLPNQRGAQPVYSDLCIESLLMFKVVFKLAYRQTQGFAQSLLKLMGVDDLEVPSYSQICRRAKDLNVIPYQIPKSGPIVITIDSTGLKIYGEGEWKVRKHGYSKRRTWRKLHLGVDPETGFIHCHTLTLNSVDDGSQLGDLLDQVETEVTDVCLDGAYDRLDCRDSLIERKINPIIPPRDNAVIWYLNEPDDIPNYPRNVAINRIDEVGKKEWKIETGYHRRSLSETAMFRYKTIHGNKLYSRNTSSQETENDIKIKTLNMMTAIGMPETARIKAV
ncbi:MAG TPA: IS5 family transposase [Bacteroidetes bacterium]|nr:IS5 family transposase [Bacteroidota bacterium]